MYLARQLRAHLDAFSPAGGRIVFSATCRTPFNPQPVTLGHRLQEHQVKPVQIYKTTCYPEAIAIHKLKAQELFFFSWGLDLKSL